MSDIGFDPCAADEEGVIDLGHDVRAKFYTHKDHDGPVGLIESHPRPDGTGRCVGGIKWVDLGGAGGGVWTLHSLDPLHVEPSLLCRECGHHGFIRDGGWVPA